MSFTYVRVYEMEYMTLHAVRIERCENNCYKEGKTKINVEIFYATLLFESTSHVLNGLLESIKFSTFIDVSCTVVSQHALELYIYLIMRCAHCCKKTQCIYWQHV